MGSDSAKKALKEFCGWLESLPKNIISWAINENPSANSTNLDYLVDYEIIIIPANNKALGITIWISDDATGFSVSDFKHAARLLGVKVRSSVSNLACSGLEPVTYVDIDAVIDICSDISQAKLDLSAFVLNGRLEGIFSMIGLNNSHDLPISIGAYRKVAKLLEAIGYGKTKSIPYEPWF
ncbi:hypothetical protein [Saccharospirillum impatiens]|uniref:hypothetical protein n=1 Tax=Saccharospirillum impatiens TaxID=169438 RepID=UPI00048CEC5B|nr:hypothetical protein [Saccharospirillum impatiens]